MLKWLLKLLRRENNKREAENPPTRMGSKQPSAISPGQQTRKPKDVRVVTVGVDFGTSSTKIILGGVLPDKHHLLSLGERTDGYPEFALPSSVQISDDHIYFGSSAERVRSNSFMFRSFKVCLACQHGSDEMPWSSASNRETNSRAISELRLAGNLV